MRRFETIALLVLVLAIFTGCASKKEPVRVDPVMDGATDGAGTALSEREGEVARAESKKGYLVEQFMKFGDEARERGDWEAARAEYAKVLKIDPGNDAARRRMDETGAVLGIDRADVRNAMDNAVDEAQVRRQTAQAEISNLVRQGQEGEKNGDFAMARMRYEKAALIVSLYPYYGDFTPNEETLKNMIASAATRKVEAAKAQRDKELRQAREIREMEEQRARESTQARLAALFHDANLAMERNQFELAREYAEQILRIDSNNQSASKLRDLARDARLATEEGDTRRNLREQWKRAFETVEESALPQVRNVIFPEEWTRVQANRKSRSFGRASAATADPRTREIENVLSTTMVNINFEDTQLQDAVTFLAQYANLNIIVLPSVFEEKSEDELLVTLKADNVSIENALSLITSIKDLSYRIDKGVVQIGTTAEARGEMVLDLYDVKDLTVPIRSFPGEDINLAPSGGFGFGLGDDDDLEPIQAFEGEALADLIRDTIDADVWDEGGDVQFREGGILIVKAPVETHARVSDLLNGLRGSGGLTVSIETRFITVSDSFLQDIGVDWRGLGDQSGGIGVAGKGRTENFDDVLFGTAAAAAGIGTGNEAGVFYNLNSDGDIRGRVENLLDVALGRSGLLTNSGGTSIQATWIDDVQAEVILRAVEKSQRATIVVAPSLTAYNHERANVTVMNEVSYIQDFDVEIAQAAQIGDPIVQTLRDGVILDITPIVSADRKYVTLELRPTVATLQRPIQTFQTTLANGPPVIIQLPEVRIQRVRTTVTMPDGGILLLGGLKFFEELRMETGVPWLSDIPILGFFFSRKGTYISRSHLIILIKAKIIILEEMAPRFGGR